MKLLLTTLHSRYIHSSLALPCIAAACSDIPGLETIILEHTVNERPEKLLVSLSGVHADIIALSCYIWNIEQTLRLAAELKILQPDIYIILGGPEVSYGTHELMTANPHIDAVVRGEGETTMRRMLQLMTTAQGEAVPEEMLLEIENISFRSSDEILSAGGTALIENLDSIPSPFAAGLADSSKPLVYIETSRGCPFSCAFCLSSAENGVRTFSMPRIENDLSLLMAQGAGTIKFVDRTFNYDSARAGQIWEFILKNNRQSRFHFEIAADLLTDDNIAILKSVPKETFRFEIGVQSTAAESLESVGRKSDLKKLFHNVRRLLKETSVTIHLDLVAGLPGEDLAGFTESLDRLLQLRPHHIQVELLKMLKGTALRKDAKESGYTFSPYPPYRILKNSSLSFEDICRIEQCANRVEEIYNSGRFAVTVEMISRHELLTPLLTAVGDANDSGSIPGNRLAGKFEAVLKLAARLSPGIEEIIRETLRFDYCMLGHPGSVLPGFLNKKGDDRTGSSPSYSYLEIREKLQLPEGSRFKTFTASFDHDFAKPDWPQENADITFIYSRDDDELSVMLMSGRV